MANFIQSLKNVSQHAALLLLLGSTLTGCGGGGQAATAPILSTPTLTEQQRSQVLADTDALLSTLPRQDVQADAQAVAKFWSSRSEIADAGVSQGHIVWARFIDGKNYTLVLNYDSVAK